jgi:hypothetical protein
VLKRELGEDIARRRGCKLRRIDGLFLIGEGIPQAWLGY